MRRRTNLSQNPITRPARGAAPDITGTITQIHRDANQTESLGASQIWSGNSLAGRSAGDGWDWLRALGEAQGRPCACPCGRGWRFEQRSLSQPCILSTRVGHMRGRVTGSPPAQERAEGPTAQMRGQRRERHSLFGGGVRLELTAAWLQQEEYESSPPLGHTLCARL